MKSLFFFLLLPLFIYADQSLYFSSPNLCARQSAEPAKSIYLFVDGFGPGRSATKWARDAELDKTQLVTSTWQQLHARSFFISKRIIELMLSKELPIISEAQLKSCGHSLDCPEYKKLVLQYKEKINQVVTTQKSAIQCTWVKKSLPLYFSTKAPSRTDLEDLAVAYLDKASYIDTCEKIFSGDTKNSSELVLKFDLSTSKDWSLVGFEFWRSFKIYLSLFWGQKWTHPALQNQEIVRSFAVDEVVTLMADGCYSLSRPECDTDFLNLTQLKSTFRKGSFQNSFLMANEIMKKQVNGFEDRINPAPQNASTVVNTRDDLLSLMKMRHQSSLQLYKSVRNLSLIFNQKSKSELVASIAPLLNPETLKPEIYTLCAEVNKIVRMDLSPFAKELSISQNKVAGLNDIPFLKKRPEDLFVLGIEYLESLKLLCEKVEQNLKLKMISSDTRDLEKMVPARRWFQTITQYSLPIDLTSSLAPAINESLMSPISAYVRLKEEVICSSVVDCTRDIMEGLVNIYQVALYRNVTASKVANEITADRHLGGDVACGLFDPWEASQLRKRKLVSDLVSSVVSGVTMLPIYLDLDFDTKNVVSFNQLYENGKIKFDPQFDDKTVRSTLFLDLGPLAKAPCYISISNSSKLKSPNRALLFQGITFQGCLQTGSGQMISNNLNVETNRSQEMSACGACMLNFEEVAVAAAANNYNVFRFGIRFVAALVTYFKEQENPVSQPIELKVNPEYVKDAYVKYNSIPDSCMYELVNGSKCMENICLSYTIAQVENTWNVKVKDGSLWNSADNGTAAGMQATYTDAWLKIDGCEREVRVPINCIQGKKPSSVNLPRSAPSCARSNP